MTCPLRTAAPATGAGLLAGRFEVHGVDDGGVLVARDRDTDQDVVIKQARPRTGDARDRLRREFGLLRRLASRGVTPRPLGLFAHDEHLFLAMELVTGTPLAAWVRDRGGRVPLADVVPIAQRLLTAVARVHAEGLAFRDLGPANVVISPEDAVTLVDLEFVTEPGSPTPIRPTPGFALPGQTTPEQSADLCSLGALLLFLTSGVTPGDERLVRMVAASHAATRVLGPAILGLLAAAPEQRWSLERTRAFLDAAAAGTWFTLLPVSDRLGAVDQHTLIVDGLAHLVDNLDPRSGDDTRNVQFGLAAPLSVLTRAATSDSTLLPTVRTAATWLVDRLEDGDRLLPGLYLGSAGAVWAVHDAARLLYDDELARRATGLAERLPIRWPNPDVTHGVAGAGLAQLHFWCATGDDAFGTRMRTCADGLVRAARWREGQVTWSVPADFDPSPAGRTHYGFAHGVAGIGAFLLAAGQTTGTPRYLELACAAGETLSAAAHRDGGAAWWPSGEERDPTQPRRTPHRRSGSSGVGTFLARLWQHTGQDRHRELAEAAARAVRDARWAMGPAPCHGLPDDGEFLLDLAGILGEPRYRDHAEELAACLDARAVLREGRRVVLDESASERGLGQVTGLSDALSFLLRLRDGGPRPWMVDGELTATAAHTVRGA